MTAAGSAETVLTRPAGASTWPVAGSPGAENTLCRRRSAFSSEDVSQTISPLKCAEATAARAWAPFPPPQIARTAGVASLAGMQSSRGPVATSHQDPSEPAHDTGSPTHEGGRIVEGKPRRLLNPPERFRPAREGQVPIPPVLTAGEDVFFEQPLPPLDGLIGRPGLVPPVPVE